MLARTTQTEYVEFFYSLASETWLTDANILYLSSALQYWVYSDLVSYHNRSYSETELIKLFFLLSCFSQTVRPRQTYSFLQTILWLFLSNYFFRSPIPWATCTLSAYSDYALWMSDTATTEASLIPKKDTKANLIFRWEILEHKMSRAAVKKIWSRNDYLINML